MARPHTLREADDRGSLSWLMAQRFRAPEREPCPYCGVRGDIGCKHREAGHGA